MCVTGAIRTLRMIRKAHPHRSVHSVTIRNYTYLIRRVRNSSYLIRKTLSIRAQIFEKYQKSSADEQSVIIRNSRHSYVNIYILIEAALDETIIPCCLHYCQSRGLSCASGLSNVNVNQYLSLFISICVTSFTYRHDVMYRTVVRWLFQHLRYK